MIIKKLKLSSNKFNAEILLIIKALKNVQRFSSKNSNYKSLLIYEFYEWMSSGSA